MFFGQLRYSAMKLARSMPLAVPFSRSTPFTSSSLVCKAFWCGRLFHFIYINAPLNTTKYAHPAWLLELKTSSFPLAKTKVLTFRLQCMIKTPPLRISRGAAVSSASPSSSKLNNICGSWDGKRIRKFSPRYQQPPNSLTRLSTYRALFSAF